MNTNPFFQKIKEKKTDNNGSLPCKVRDSIPGCPGLRLKVDGIVKCQDYLPNFFF